MAAGIPLPAANDLGWVAMTDEYGNALNSGFVKDESLDALTGVLTTRATFASASTFTLVGDQTATYYAGRRLVIVHGGGTTYCRVQQSVFGAVTTVTIANAISVSRVLAAFPTSSAAIVGHWSSPENAYADDGVITGTSTVPQSTDEWGTFGFDSLIPTGAVITAVKIIDKSRSARFIAMNPCEALVSGSGTNHSHAVTSSSFLVYTTDVTADRAWARADLLNGTFTVQMGGNDAAFQDLEMDYVKVEVTFLPSVAVLSTPITSVAFGELFSGATGNDLSLADQVMIARWALT